MNRASAAIRVAIVGAGGIARGSHLPALAGLRDRATVVAVVDVNQQLAEQVARDWAIPSVFTDVARMLSKSNPEIVFVCTPPVAHKEAVVQSLQAGAWVLCEKPPALSLAEYDEMASYEGEGGPYVSYVFQHRFGSAAQTLRNQIRSRALGAPLVSVCHTLWYREPSYFDLPWRGKWATEGGGPTMGHGIHQMDLLLSLLGDWTDVQSTTATLERQVETEDVSFATVRFENGAISSIVNSLLSPRETSYLRFDFTDATVEVEHLYGYDNSNWRWTAAPHIAENTREGWLPITDTKSSHAAQIEALFNAYDAKRRPAASGADGRKVLELIAAIYKSAASGDRVQRGQIDPADPFYASMNGLVRKEELNV